MEDELADNTMTLVRDDAMQLVKEKQNIDRMRHDENDVELT